MGNFKLGRPGGAGERKRFVCGACGRESILKNNLAIAAEYRRLRKLQQADATHTSCQRAACSSFGKCCFSHPHRYRKSGRTGAGNQRFICKQCGSTFTTGSPTRNQHHSEKNGQVLKLLVNGTAISKISEILGISHRDVYSKIDFIYERVRHFTALREADLRDVEWDKVGRRFVTDSQSLTLNWPHRKTKAFVAVQHLCTALANTGFIVLGHLQFDPGTKMDAVEANMIANGDIHRDRCFRRLGRFWTATEFKDFLDQKTAGIQFDPEEAPDVELGLQLPHSGALVRQDIQQFAHALILRRMISKSESRFVFVQDRDPGLSKAFLAAFAPEIISGRVDVATVKFDKYETNDVRERLAAEGRRALRIDCGLTAHEINSIPAFIFNQEIDRQIELRLCGCAIGTPSFGRTTLSLNRIEP